MTVVVYRPVETERPGFYIIPGYTRYGASCNNQIINLKTGHLKRFYMVRGYAATTVANDKDGKMKWMFIHRLVALAFHGPQPDNKPLVNHRDGDKRNNHPDNLVWADHSDNIYHAYRAGLRSDNRPVLAKDLRDDSIQRFDSISACAKRFNVNSERIWRNIRDNTGNIYFSYYVFRYENDKRPWPNLSSADIGKVNNGDPKPILAKEVATGRVIVANSAEVLSAIVGVKANTISYAIRTGKQYQIRGFLFKLLSDATPWINDNTTKT